ncbi:MAG TPA: LysR family transcriptional regulator [Piscirickettsiaceae bacterium]|nr:LysR family transcriptional regulator [Piscirickettsiaceae bacterium]
MRQKLNLDALVVLDAIARKSSFAAAAKELYRVPSSVTYTIQKLEDSLDIALFDRRGHRAYLTPAGKVLLNEGRGLLSMVDDVERKVQRIATGWEAELRIAVDDLIPYEKVLDLCEEFYQFSPDTQLHLTTEVLGGAWDAIASGRADLVIGASGDGPSDGVGYTLHPMGEIELIFVVAPNHPLAKVAEPLTNTLIRKYRAIVAADSSRQLSPRTVGLLPGQPSLTVSNIKIKLEAQKKGLGIGYLPRHMITKDLEQGNLIIKATEDGLNPLHSFYYVWRNNHHGKALTWFKEQLCENKKKIDWFYNG